MTMKKRELVPKIARWALFLEEFEYTIEHRPGIRLKHADALSRNPVLVVTRSEFMERIRRAQMEDEHIGTIKRLLEQDCSYQDYFIENGLVYKTYQGTKLFVTPKKMEAEIIRTAHEQYGHFSVKKTEELILREYWIPDVKEKIKSYIRNCIPCILAERKSGKQEGELNPIEKNLPLDTYHIDHLGPLSSTRKGYKYLLVVVDGFTKFVWIYPTKTMSSQEVVEKLDLQKKVFGNPRRIISDRGAAFTSDTFKDYCKKEKISLVHITTGIPRGNGQVERMNRIIIPVLTKLSLGKEEDWFKHVDKVQTAVNGTYQRSISTTPFRLLFGVDHNHPHDIKLQEIIQVEYMKLFDENRQMLRSNARMQIQKLQEENKRYYNKKRKVAVKYKIGDLVAIKRTQFAQRAKLRSKFIGPYKIVAVKGKDRYEVERIGPGEAPSRTTTAADFMKPWTSSSNQIDEDMSSLFADDDGGETGGGLMSGVAEMWDPP